MRLRFPILATVVSLLLAAGYYSGLVGRVDALGLGTRFASMALAVAIHAWAFAYFRSTARRVEAIASQGGLPGWVGAQADRNRRKALLFQVLGSVIAVGGLGLLVGEYVHPIVSGSSVAFQIGAFINEFLMIENQSRLLEDLGRRSGPGGSAIGP